MVLDIIHRLQQTQAGDLAVRWNCKAGKCGSCWPRSTARPRLLCMTRMSTFDRGRDHHRHAAADLPGDPRPGHRCVVQLREGPGDTVVHAAGRPAARRVPDGSRSTSSGQQEFRKCIECFLCQNTCHVVRDHEENKKAFAGPRFLMRQTELDMHPLDALHASCGTGAGRARPWLLQHHQVLHRGVPRAHQDHRQRDYPAEGAGG